MYIIYIYIEREHGTYVGVWRLHEGSEAVSRKGEREIYRCIFIYSYTYTYTYIERT